MHMDVSCAYLRAYLYVSFNRYAQIKQCISVEYHLKNTCRYAHAGPLMMESNWKAINREDWERNDEVQSFLALGSVKSNIACLAVKGPYGLKRLRGADSTEVNLERFIYNNIGLMKPETTREQVTDQCARACRIRRGAGPVVTSMSDPARRRRPGNW